MAVPNDNNQRYTSAAFVNKLACVLHNTILALVHCNAISRSMSYELHMSAEHYSPHLVVLCGLACCLAGAGRFTRLFSDPGISRWAPHEAQDSAHDVIGRDHAPIVLTCSQPKCGTAISQYLHLQQRDNMPVRDGLGSQQAYLPWAITCSQHDRCLPVTAQALHVTLIHWHNLSEATRLQQYCVHIKNHLYTA